MATSPQPVASGVPSIPDQRWRLHPEDPVTAQRLAEALGVSPLVAQVLLNREVDTVEAAQQFLQPEQISLPSPLADFPDLKTSVDLLAGAIAQGQTIAICGDYDADGMTSTALLLRALRFLGAEVTYAIPSRMAEGYGINRRIVADFAAEGIGLILTVDNGIAAMDPIAYARELGLVVIVTDHHDVPPELPPAQAILNPKLIRPESPYRTVAGVGVAYILAVCLAQALGRTQDLTAPLLELFTLGTIADLAPLTGVNRRWVKRGLALLPKSRIVGIQALIQVAGLGDQSATLKPEDIGFRLGPRINAVGRISDPQIVIEMLTTEDVGLALERAMQCEQANQTRRDWCDRIEREAIAWCEAEQASGGVDLLRDRVLVVIQPDWHHGVIGIVASRLVERYGVPVFIGTYEDEEHREIRGSARSIPEFNVFDGLQTCRDLMTKFGGHRAAGGFTFPAENLAPVKARLVAYAHQVLAPEHLKPLVTVDAQAAFSVLSFDLLHQLDRLHPCGIDNPDPVFWSAQVQIKDQKVIGKDHAHLKLTLTQGEGHPFTAIAWRWGHHYPLPSPLDVAYRLTVNEWQGQRSLQLELLGVRPIATAPGKNRPVPENPRPWGGGETGPGLGVSFQHQGRVYWVTSPQGEAPGGTLLHIQNSDGQRLEVHLPQRQGLLTAPDQPPRPVDLGEPFYWQLLQGAITALELTAPLPSDPRDRHIALLRQQVALLTPLLGHLPPAQQAEFHRLCQGIATLPPPSPPL